VSLIVCVFVILNDNNNNNNNNKLGPQATNGIVFIIFT